MKERAKLYKAQKNRVSHNLSKRLGHEEENNGDSFQDPIKKKKFSDGSYSFNHHFFSAVYDTAIEVEVMVIKY